MSSVLLPFLIVGVGIAVAVVFLAATRRSVSSPVPLSGGRQAGREKYPSGFWMTVGIAGGVVLGLAIGLAAHSLPGGIMIGIGVGLLAGKLLDKRFEPEREGELSEEERRERQRRAGLGTMVMLILLLATLAAAILPLLGPSGR